MPDRVPLIDPAARARRRAAPGRASRAEVTALVEKAALVPDGLVLLQRAPLECVAVLLGVEPLTVERVRAALEDPATRDEAASAFAQAAARRPASAPAPAGPAAPRDPEALLLAARAREDGLALLLSAAPEAAAVAFGVHPELVHRVRDLTHAAPPPPAD